MKLSSLPQGFLIGPSSQFVRVGFVISTLILGQWFLNDFVHIPGGGLGLFAAGAGIWWLSKPIAARFEAPNTLQGWVNRCQKVLQDFESLDQDSIHETNKERSDELQKIISMSGPQSLALVTSVGGALPEKSVVEAAFESHNSLNFCWSSPLPLADESWHWPDQFHEKDALLYFLPLPLRAADLIWLEQVPNNQPAWVVVSWDESLTWLDEKRALHAQLPHRWTGRVLRLLESEDSNDLQKSFLPVRRLLENPKKNLDITKQRLLSRLHLSWQAELENLRRERFKSVQLRSQWLVAGAVFASPVATTDLLSVAVVNGLMIKDMTKIWGCSWKPEVLQIAARQLAGAALAQGVVEWSGQALLAAAKLDGTSWFAAGSLQALNAAYLTRVVGRSMADWLALNNGVAEPDLDALKNQAPQLVSKAADEERVDWSAFLKQSSVWLKERAIPVALIP